MKKYMSNRISIDARNILQHKKAEMEKSFKRDLLVSLVCPFIGCISLYFVPFVDVTGNSLQTVGAYSIALIFWGSIIIEIFFSYQCTKTRKAMEDRLFMLKSPHYSHPGVISFFKNREAFIADIILFASAILVAALLWRQAKTGWMILVGVSLFLLSFNMHCLLNGRNYRYYKALKDKSREEKKHHE